MPRNNDDFFQEKKAWSEVKDQLFECYFKPYVAKILHTHKPLTYIDCFAGKGKFEDGKPGSPLIALDVIEECLRSTTHDNPCISTTFIELKYGRELQEVLSDYPSATVVSGRYEEQIFDILRDKVNTNVFLYLDPYGIKSLHFPIFDTLAKNGFNSVELLINLNTFGFIREACSVLGTTLILDDPTVFDDLVEYDSTNTTTPNSIHDLDVIAGGNYWQAIIKDYRDRRKDGYQAEECFAKQYCQRLSKDFTYVLNMPLRIRQGQRPKYRMIHATNHPDGCLLMVDNIWNRWQLWQTVQNNRQLSLIPEDPNNNFIDDTIIKNKAKEHFSSYNVMTSYNKALAEFYMRNGAICEKHKVAKVLKEFEKEGHISVLRNPAFTATGRPTTFMSESSNQKVHIKWES